MKKRQRPTRALVGVLIESDRGEFLTSGTGVWREPRENLRKLFQGGSVVERETALGFLHDPQVVEELRDMPDVASGRRWRAWKVSVGRKPSGWKK